MLNLLFENLFKITEKFFFFFKEHNPKRFGYIYVVNNRL